MPRELQEDRLLPWVSFSSICSSSGHDYLPATQAPVSNNKKLDGLIGNTSCLKTRAPKAKYMPTLAG